MKIKFYFTKNNKVYKSYTSKSDWRKLTFTRCGEWRSFQTICEDEGVSIIDGRKFKNKAVN